MELLVVDYKKIAIGPCVDIADSIRAAKAVFGENSHWTWILGTEAVTLVLLP